MHHLAGLLLEHEKATTSGVDNVAQWLDLRNMLPVARAILGSALRGAESRGAHSRTDFPDRCDEKWRGTISCHLDGDEMEFQFVPG